MQNIVLLAFLIITISGCCLAVDCSYDDGPLKLRLMRDGKNALYGPDAFLTPEDVKLIVLASDEPHEEYIQFDTSLQAIQVYVFSDLPTILEIKNISSDTLSFTSEKLPIRVVVMNIRPLCSGMGR